MKAPFSTLVAVALLLPASLAQSTPESCPLLASWPTYIASPGTALGALSLCTTSVPSGILYLIQPRNFTFTPIPLANVQNNAYTSPALIPSDFTQFGYGYRAIVAASSTSLSSPLITSPTFAIVSPTFYTSTIAQNAYTLLEPPGNGTAAAASAPQVAWGSTGEKRLVWAAEAAGSGAGPNVTALLYNSANVRLGHLTLASSIPSSSSSGGGAVEYFYFTYPGALFPGSDYQVVIRPSTSTDPSEILAVSEPISIVSGSLSLPTSADPDGSLPQTTILAPGQSTSTSVPGGGGSAKSGSARRSGLDMAGAIVVLAAASIAYVL